MLGRNTRNYQLWIGSVLCPFLEGMVTNQVLLLFGEHPFCHAQKVCVGEKSAVEITEANDEDTRECLERIQAWTCLQTLMCIANLKSNHSNWCLLCRLCV